MSEEKNKQKIILNKTPIPEQDPKERSSNFEEVTLGYSPEMAIKEAGRCLQCKKPLCVEGCPVHIPIPQFIKAIKEGDFKNAIDLIKTASFLPAVCGRVCPQEDQCEKNCSLGKKASRLPLAVLRGLLLIMQCSTGMEML